MDLLFTFLLLLIKELFFLSRNSLFFYSSGVSLGLIMSLLLLVYILHRLIPGVRESGVVSMLRPNPGVFLSRSSLFFYSSGPGCSNVGQRSPLDKSLSSG